MKFTKVILANVLLFVTYVNCELECYTCHANEDPLKDRFISEVCNVKKKCGNYKYCLSMTYKYNGLSYQKRGCMESDQDYPCNRLWSDCQREFCLKDLCNSSHQMDKSLFWVPLLFLIIIHALFT